MQEEPDKTELRLTDAFGGKAEGKEPCLECVATMLNINYGHNKEIMEKCKRLEEYAVFVATVRTYVEAGQDRETAVTMAVDGYIEKGILTDILMKQRAEVISMILRSYRDEEYEKAMQTEWYEEGRAEGRAEERKRMNKLVLKLMKDGRLEELERAVSDMEFQEKLLMEYELKEN